MLLSVGWRAVQSCFDFCSRIFERFSSYINTLVHSVAECTEVRSAQLLARALGTAHIRIEICLFALSTPRDVISALLYSRRLCIACWTYHTRVASACSTESAKNLASPARLQVSSCSTACLHHLVNFASCLQYT